jgi:DNA-binding transcriptional ArsR family regulator
MDTTRVLAGLGALAQESRLAVFRALVQAGPAGLAAGQIAERLGLPGPTLSFHLAQLKVAGLVTCRRESRSLIYAANYAATRDLVGYLLENCCSNESTCEVSSCSPPPTRAISRTRGERHEASARARRGR